MKKITKIVTLVFLALLLSVSIGIISACTKDKDFTISAEEITLEEGQSKELTAYDGGGADLVWSSSDQSVAIYDNGKVYGLAAGNATITVSNGNAKLSCAVTVTKKEIAVPSVKTITLSALSKSIQINETFEIVAVVNENGEPTSTEAEFNVSPEGIVAYEKIAGGLKIIGVTEGKATITAKSGDSTASCIVSVIQMHDATGTVTIDKQFTADIALAKVIFLNKDDGSDEVAEVDSEGNYKVNVKTGNYDVSITHPNFKTLEINNQNISEDLVMPEGIFEHYGFGNQIYNSTWAYNQTEKTLNLTKVVQTAPDDQMSQYYLLGTASTQSVYSATITSEGGQDSKIGLVFAGTGDNTSILNKYSVAITPKPGKATNQVNFYVGQGTQLKAGTDFTYTFFNEAALSTADANRFSLPNGIISFTQTDNGYTLTPLKITVVRDNDDVYFFFNNVLYIKINLPAIKDVEGMLGFRNQNQATAVFSDIHYDLGESAVDNFLESDIQINQFEHGKIAFSVDGGEFADNKRFNIASTVKIKITPDTQYTIESFAVNDEDKLSYLEKVDDSFYYTIIGGLKKDLSISIGFKYVEPQYSVTGKVKVDASLGTIALSEATVKAERASGIPVGASVDSEGKFTLNLEEGEYTVTISHPQLSDIIINNVTVSGSKIELDEQTFEHYGFGNQINDSIWSYNETDKTLYLTKAGSGDPSTMSQYYLLGTASTQSVYSAAITSEGGQDSKIGLVFAGTGDNTSILNKYSVAITPKPGKATNQVNFYVGQGTQLKAGTDFTYTLFNEAALSTADANRFSLPNGIISFTQTDNGYTLTPLQITVVRDNDDVYFFFNNVLYIKINLPAIKDVEGFLGFRNQNQATAVFSDIHYDLGQEAVTSALNNDIEISEYSNGTVNILVDGVAQNTVSTFLITSEVKIKISAAEGYKIGIFNINEENCLSELTQDEDGFYYYTVAAGSSKDISVEINFTNTLQE